ncbi:MAG: hypothetical protein QXV17_04345 [Candidatus Micrarchaeaceae archaeon]
MRKYESGMSVKIGMAAVLVIITVLLSMALLPATEAQPEASVQAFVIGENSNPVYANIFYPGFVGNVSLKNGIEELQYVPNLLATQASRASILVYAGTGQLLSNISGPGYYVHGAVNFTFFGQTEYVIQLFYSPSGSNNESRQAIIHVYPACITVYPVTFTETGLPEGYFPRESSWYVTAWISGTYLDGTVLSSGSIVQMAWPNGTYNFSVTSLVGEQYVAIPANGTFTVDGHGLNLSVVFSVSGENETTGE